MYDATFMIEISFRGTTFTHFLLLSLFQNTSTIDSNENHVGFFFYMFLWLISYDEG